MTRVTIIRARVRDAAVIAVLRTAAGAVLTKQFGRGWWSSAVTERFVRFRIRNDEVYVVRRRGRIVATVTRGLKKPWSSDRSLYPVRGKPAWLIDLAVDPTCQRRGIGRATVEAFVRRVRAAGADFVGLDAWDAPAGAGGFYRACGFRQVGRAAYRGTRLRYFLRQTAGGRR